MTADQIKIEQIGSDDAIHNWLDARIAEFNNILAKRPASAIIMTPFSLSWKNELLIRYGRMVGAIEILASLKHIKPETAVRLWNRLKGATHTTINDLVAGRL